MRKVVRKVVRKAWLKAGHLAEGGALKLIQIVSKKVLKGKSLSTIAHELEETEDTIRPIYDLFVSNPEADPEEILARL